MCVRTASASIVTALPPWGLRDCRVSNTDNAAFVAESNRLALVKGNPDLIETAQVDLTSIGAAGDGRGRLIKRTQGAERCMGGVGMSAASSAVNQSDGFGLTHPRVGLRIDGGGALGAARRSHAGQSRPLRTGGH